MAMTSSCSCLACAVDSSSHRHVFSGHVLTCNGLSVVEAHMVWHHESSVPTSMLTHDLLTGRSPSHSALGSVGRMSVFHLVRVRVSGQAWAHGMAGDWGLLGPWLRSRLRFGCASLT